MLKIAVDATPIAPKPSGVGLYVTNLIRSLYTLQETENFELRIVYQPGFKKWLRGDWSFPESLQQYPHLHLFPMPVRVSNFFIYKNLPIVWSLCEKSMRFPDIIHGTDYSVYPCKKSLKVFTIHDLTFLKYPKYIDSVVKTYAKRIRRCLEWTDLILTVSENSKKDIVECLNIKSEKIYVTLLSSRYSSDYLLIKPGDRIRQQTHYDFSHPYLLFVSNLEPRKNILSIIKAFNYLKQKYKIDHDLILIGRKGWYYEPIIAAIESSSWKHQIHHLDYLSDELVALFYSKADVFVYPSYYEGFGLPVLEAMTLGAPVVASNTSSLPEVAGDAALFIDPNDPIQLAEAILKVISDRQLRQELIDKGQKRAKLFSWERTARETLKAYKTLI
jgi:glycosyltransferase involved in cell wall biosynthesis